MIELIKEGLTNKANGGLFIILSVMLTTIYGIHTFSKDERGKSDLKIQKLTIIIEDQQRQIYEIDKIIHVHIARDALHGN